MAGQLNLGIVGTGLFATDKHLPTLNKIDELKITGCYNRTKAKAEVFAEKAGLEKSAVYDSLEAIFEDDKIDAVDVLLPVQYNLDAVKLAIKNKKPIAFEKPIAANMEQAKEIVNLSRKTDLPILVLENWAYSRAISVLKEEVLPKIGNIISFTYHATGAWNADNKYLTTSWRQNPEHIGGFLSDGGVHQLALLTEVLGEVKTVSGFTKQVRKESGADDILFSTFKLKSDVIGSFTYGSAFGATDKSTSFTIFGDNGSVVYNFSPSLPKPTITYQTGTDNKSASEKTVIELDEVDTFVEEFKDFTKAVTSNNKDLVHVKAEVAFHHLAIVAAALESSANNGTSVTVETV